MIGLPDPSEKLAALREPFPGEAIDTIPRETRDGGTVHLDYVGHAWVTDRLLHVDPFWSWEPFAVNDDGTPVVVVRDNQAQMWIRLTVCGVTRIGVGTCSASKEEIEKELIGDAIRNAAMRFGVALDLWKKHRGGDGGGDTAQPRSGTPSRGNTGQGTSRATDKQIGLIKRLLGEKDYDDEPDLNSITKRDASTLIETLKALPDRVPATRGATVDEAVAALNGEPVEEQF